VPDAPPLTYRDTVRILARLQGLDHPIVLVGGQAVNFWASYYADRVEELRAGAPYASKDIDFEGSHDAVEECARRLNGEARLATLDDPGTPNTGIVAFIDDDHHLRTIDFLLAPAGLNEHDVVTTSIPVTVLAAEGALTFSVLHPALTLRSRVYNVAYLPSYDSAHALRQLRAAILCARAYVGEAIEDGDLKRALRANEHAYKTARYKGGAQVHTRHHIDPFDAVLADPRLPDKFLAERYPRMRADVDRAYARCAEAQRRAAAFAAP
jgi:hypothetical protein